MSRSLSAGSDLTALGNGNETSRASQEVTPNTKDGEQIQQDFRKAEKQKMESRGKPAAEDGVDYIMHAPQDSIVAEVIMKVESLMAAC